MTFWICIAMAFDERELGKAQDTGGALPLHII